MNILGQIQNSQAVDTASISLLEPSCRREPSKRDFGPVTPEPLYPVYMDYASTTQMDRRVLDKLYQLLSDRSLGNSHSKHHSYGRRAAAIVNQARTQIADCLKANSSEITFTSGATESNNLVIAGLADHLLRVGKTNIITSAIEHKSILEPLFKLKKKGFKITLLHPKSCGMIEASAVAQALEPETGLVSIQAVNNETGTIQPLQEIAHALKGKEIFLHTDAAQALGKMGIDEHTIDVDFASFSAHKAYGPQGIGALYIKQGQDKFLQAQMLGGGQEGGIRSGTIPIALCGAFGEACSILSDDRQKLQTLRQLLLDKIEGLNPVVHGHSDPNWNVPGILNIRFPGIDCETLLMMLPMVALSSGSACSGAREATSHVIESITGSKEAARESIRISFGRYTSSDEIELVAEQLIAAVTEVRVIQEV